MELRSLCTDLEQGNSRGGKQPCGSRRSRARDQLVVRERRVFKRARDRAKPSVPVHGPQIWSPNINKRAFVISREQNMGEQPSIRRYHS